MSVTILNATCVPAISLSVNGEMSYPNFPQGAQTGHAARTGLQCRYHVTDLQTGRKADSGTITFKTGSDQTLVIAGDFSTDVPPGVFPQPGHAPQPPQTPFPPNVHFLVYPYAKRAGGKNPSFRFVNAMPRIPLEIAGPSLTKTTLLPGKDLLLKTQPRPATYAIEAGGKTFTITLITKEDANQLIVFYLKGGIPAYKAIIEESEETPVNPGTANSSDKAAE